MFRGELANVGLIGAYFVHLDEWARGPNSVCSCVYLLKERAVFLKLSVVSLHH
jgi:hypothetical protein